MAFQFPFPSHFPLKSYTSGLQGPSEVTLNALQKAVVGYRNLLAYTETFLLHDILAHA